MSTRAEMLTDWSEGRQEALGMAGGFEPSRRAFTLTCRLMRVLRAVVEAAVLTVFDARQDLTFGGAIAGKLVSDEHPGHVGAALEELTEKLLGGHFVPSTLDQNIQHMTILVNGLPEVRRFAIDFE